VKQQEKTNRELLREIKKMAGLPVNDNYWFSRKEMKKIIGKINPKVKWATNDKEKKGYIRTVDLFPRFLSNWKKQSTVNTHPHKHNLKMIYGLLSSSVNSKRVVLPTPQKISATKLGIRKTIPQWKQDLISAIKSLPDNTNHWSGEITGVGQVSINTRGKHDK
tara:strand:- start:10019 stop:10507 length:489 start_codon:yes stop_codon:yes gene_type:complete